MVESIITARPAPPKNCIKLRHRRKIGGVSDTLITVSPVVVHPLTASKIPLRGERTLDKIKGREENPIASIHPKKTIIPPSGKERAGLSWLRHEIQRINPNKMAAIAGRAKFQK